MKKDNQITAGPIEQDPPNKQEAVGSGESTATQARESLIISVEELNDATQMDQDNCDAVVSSVEQTQEEKQENDTANETISAQYVVCKGATCNCDGNPSAKGTLEVTTHKKYYINDQGTDKPIATVEDVMFKEGVSPFITCSHKKGNDKTCTYAPKGKWKVPNNAKFPEVGGKDILTELGTLSCAIGGTLTIMTHGQTVDIDGEDVQEVEDAFVDMSAINAMLSYEELPSEEQKYPEEYVSDVSKLEYIASEDIILTPQSEGNTRAFYVLKGQFVDFRATVTVNTADKHKRRGNNISWGITEILSEDVFTGAKSSSSKTYKLQLADQNKVVYKAFKRVTNPFGFAFAKSGRYIIDASSREKEAGKEWAYYKDQYFYIEVVDQASITALSVKGINQEIFIGNEVTITVISNLPLSSTTLRSLTITIASVSITGQESILYSYRDSSIESMVNSKRYTQTANKLEAKFTCVNSGLFTIKILQDGQELTAFRQSMEVLENKVIDIKQVEGRIRRGTQASYQAILKNGNTVDTTKIRWRIISPQGRTYGEEKVGETGIFVFRELGKYALQCLYGSRLFFDQEKVQKQIEVIDNKIEGVTVQHAVAKEEGENYTVFVNQRVVVHIGTPLDYVYEAVAPTSNTSALNFHASNEEALVYIHANKSKKDPLLLYSLSYLGKGSNQTEGEIKLSREITKKIGITPVYFTASTATLDLTLCSEGMYFLSVQLGQDTPVEVVLNSRKGRIKQWFFHDGKHKTTRIGYKQNFGITATVEGWTNKKGKLHIWWDNRTNGGTILKHSKAAATIEKERHHLIYSQEVTFDSKGVLNRTIGEGTDFWKKLVEVVGSKQTKEEIFNFYFTLSEVEVPCENQNEEVYHSEFRKGHVFPNQSIASGTYAILAEQPHGVGKFVDKDKKALDAIVQYTDQTSIALQLYKGFENEIDQTIYEIHLYENKKGDDKFIECYNIVAHETEIVNYIQLPTSSAAYGSSTHVQDKGNEKNPRLFYFILYKWKKEDQKEFNRLKGQPAQKRSTYSNSSKLKFRMMYPENLGVKSQNDSSIIELEEEDKAQYIANLKKKKAEKKRKQELNQKYMANAIEGMNDRGDEFRKKYAPFIQIYEQLDREIKAIDQEIQTLSAYNARIARNNAKMSEGRKGVKNYFQQLKLAVNPIYNEVQNRNKKRVPVKVESGNSESAHRKDCICKQLYFGMYLKSCEERKKVIEVAGRLWGEEDKIKWANYIMTIIYTETNKTYDPSIKNTQGNVGLIQFGKSGSKDIGTTQDDLAKMTFVEQMDYVEKFLKKNYTKLKVPVDLYLMIFRPITAGNGSNPNYVILDSEIKEQRNAYRNNPKFMLEKEEKLLKNGKTYVWEVDEIVQEVFSWGSCSKYIGACDHVDKEKFYNYRAPWMYIAIEKAKEMKGSTEDSNPMYLNAKTYLRYCDNMKEPTDGTYGPWCAAFMNWCVKHVGYSHVASAASLAPLWDKSNRYKKIEEPIYGCIVVYMSDNGRNGHTGFLYGLTKEGNNILLGGNQDDRIAFAEYGLYADRKKTKKLYGYYIPSDYEVNESDKLTEDDRYDFDYKSFNASFGISVEKESKNKTN
ncbi:TIGR02594 family protein [Myroides fluvii]|uniref:TIGR02594 family protein n=1 Tax=Myroides fluvii TaxID=2572594 RepID=UPI00131C0FBA|nr:TIGR02594 family protein [Myroides fluvii]